MWVTRQFVVGASRLDLYFGLDSGRRIDRIATLFLEPLFTPRTAGMGSETGGLPADRRGAQPADVGCASESLRLHGSH